MKITNEALENAINDFQDNGNISVLQEFFGKVDNLEPFGDSDLAKVINTGDMYAIKQKLHNITTIEFDDMPNLNKETTYYVVKTPDKSGKQYVYQVYSERELKNLVCTLDAITENNLVNKGYIFVDATPNKSANTDFSAEEDLKQYEEEKKELENEDAKKYIDEKIELAKKYAEKTKENKSIQPVNNTGFSNRGNTMKMSKKDFSNLMTSLKFLVNNFSEIELPTDVAEDVKSALNGAGVQTTEEKQVSEPAEDEVAVEEVTSEDMEEFCNFAEVVTDKIEAIKVKVEELGDRIDEAQTVGVIKNKETNTKTGENFSVRKFIQFCDSLTCTVEKLADKLDDVESKVERLTITKNIDSLEDSITENNDSVLVQDKEPAVDAGREEKKEKEEAVIPPVEPISGDTLPETTEQFSQRYNRVKSLFNL